MEKKPTKAEQTKKASENNWIYNAQLNAEEFKILRNQEGKILSQEDKKGIYKHLNEQSEWSRKAQKYLSISKQNGKTVSNVETAAKLAACGADAEKKLITAIELSRSGYIVCSLAAILQVVEQEELSSDDRINACALVIENILTSKYAFAKQMHTIERNQEWLYIAKQSQEIAKVFGIIINTHQSQEKLYELSKKLKNLIELADAETSIKAHKQERAALKLANKRNLIIQELAKTHQKPIIRSIHHLACTGGTLISKCVASMADVALISEVNPMNRSDSEFTPTNPLLLLERSHREFTKGEKIDIFREQIRHAYKLCQKDDIDLILRDHSHTDFHTGSAESDYCAIKDCLRLDYDLISIVTIRHPLDSYLGVIAQGWEKQFSPSNLNEYSRRYLAFIAKYSSIEMIRYEDLCEDPPGTMKKICQILKISYNEDFLNTFGSHKLSGDSGRNGLKVIERRPRRPIPKELASQLEKSKYYFKLLERLGY